MGGVSAQQKPHPMDSVELSLITCSPHEELYSLYGHTALRYHNLRNGRDLAFNWGVFNFHAPHFILRFVLGLTDYELGIYPYPIFLQEYKQWGCQVTEQVLNLTNEEKLSICEALAINDRPENRVYRYNFFYDNCSTRPMKIITDHIIDAKIIRAERPDYTPTWREIIHQQTRNHPWAAFGNDLLLGFKADMKPTLIEQEFLPENLLYDFDRISIYKNGEYRPLVKERRVPVMSGVQVIEQDFLFSPTECAIALLALSLIILAFEWKRQQTLIWWDTVLMLSCGIIGLLLFVMLFSQHPTTSTNLQIFLFNPAPLFFLYPVIKRKRTLYWKLSSAMLVLFLTGAFFQDYAEGLEIVALSLLTRNISHFKHEK